MDYDAALDELLDHMSAKFGVDIREVSLIYEYLYEHGFLGDDRAEATSLKGWLDGH